jgi:hypothetical protein
LTTVAEAAVALMETVVMPSTPTEAVGIGTGFIIGVGIGAVGVVSLAKFFSFSTATSLISSSISSSGKTSSWYLKMSLWT